MTEGFVGRRWGPQKGEEKTEVLGVCGREITRIKAHGLE